MALDKRFYTVIVFAQAAEFFFLQLFNEAL